MIIINGAYVEIENVCHLIAVDFATLFGLHDRVLVLLDTHGVTKGVSIPAPHLGTRRHLLFRTAREIVRLHHHLQYLARLCQLLLVQIRHEVVLNQQLLRRDVVHPNGQHGSVARADFGHVRDDVRLGIAFAIFGPGHVWRVGVHVELVEAVKSDSV